VLFCALQGFTVSGESASREREIMTGKRKRGVLTEIWVRPQFLNFY
jgi:hypothetical protein